MIDFTAEQLKALTIWANEKLLDILDGADYDGDAWYTVDASIPELAGKIDINIYDKEEEDGTVMLKCVAYEVVNKRTKCDAWVNIF